MASKTPIEMLQSQQQRLATVQGVQTCKIGLEPNLPVGDYPIIRITPIRITPRERHGFEFEFWVYFGAAVQQFTGLDLVYAALLDMEQEIISCVTGNHGEGVTHIETITDDVQGFDANPAYKIMMARFQQSG